MVCGANVDYSKLKQTNKILNLLRINVEINPQLGSDGSRAELLTS